jgi:mycothione reductase
VIASGTRPRIPKIRGLQGSGYITSDEALRLRKQPKVLTIIGGGYIGCELAHFFGALGTKINIIQRDSALIPSVEFVSKRHLNDYDGNEYDPPCHCQCQPWHRRWR